LIDEKMMTRMTPRMMRRVPWISFLVTAVEERKRRSVQRPQTRRRERREELTRSDLSIETRRE